MKLRLNKSLLLFLSLFFSLCTIIPLHASSSYQFPSKIELVGKYLFFMHGAIVENYGVRGVHPKHPEWGRHDYYGILKAFEKKGFTVISDVRPKGTHVMDYSKKVVGQVNALLNAGVPEENIIVSGFSKGGIMTKIVSILLQKQNIKYVILAGCCSNHPKHGLSYRKKIFPMAKNLMGRFLSIYDTIDDECQSCESEFAQAESKQIETKEIVLKKWLGHGMFWTTRKEWMEPMFSWIEGS